jgi:hypothetical protein
MVACPSIRSTFLWRFLPEFQKGNHEKRITRDEISEIEIATIKRMEASNGISSAHAQTLDQPSKALESAGVEFIGTPNNRPCLRLKK